MLVKAFCLVLAFASTYAIVSAFTILVRLRSMKAGSSFSEHPALVLQGQCANLRQLLNAAFYLFGFIFFLASPWTTMILGDSRVPALFPILRNLLDYLIFASYVFSVFFVLHSVQWFVSARVNARALQLREQLTIRAL